MNTVAAYGNTPFVDEIRAYVIRPYESEMGKMNWTQIGNLEDIPRQGSRVVNTAKGEIALFRSVDDQVFALDNRCPHKGGPLSQGIVHGKRVTCPLHSWVISLESGEAVAPDVGCAHRHEVRVAHGVLFLEVKA